MPSTHDSVERLPPSGYSVRAIQAGDTAEVIAFIRAHYPDVSVGSESVFLDQAFLENHVRFADSDASREILAFVALSDTEELAAFLAVEHDAPGRVLHGRLALVHPEHRRSGLAQFFAGPFVDNLASELGVELVLSFATLKHPWSQALLEANGYDLVGLVPGHDRDLVAPETVKRVWEALYAKIIVSRGDVMTPDTASMGPRVARLFHAMSRQV